jgi:hypothetical protein
MRLAKLAEIGVGRRVEMFTKMIEAVPFLYGLKVLLLDGVRGDDLGCLVP